MGQGIENFFWQEQDQLLNFKKQTLKNHLRLYLYHQVIKSVPKCFNIRQNDNFTQQIKKNL